MITSQTDISRVFVTKPVKVNVCRLSASHSSITEIRSWMAEHGVDSYFLDGSLMFIAPGGLRSAREGDFIVLDDFGFNAVPPAIFSAHYEVEIPT